MKEFDENEAVDFMRANVPAEVAQRYSDDDMLYFIDTLWECYDKLNMFEIDDENADEDAERRALLQSLNKLLCGDKFCQFEPDHIAALLDAETAYEETLF